MTKRYNMCPVILSLPFALLVLSSRVLPRSPTYFVILSLSHARHMKDLFFVILILPLALPDEESQKT